MKNNLQRNRKKAKAEKGEMKICAEDRRREKGSGIGKSDGEGGTSEE